MDREAWRAAVHRVAKSQTQLRDWTELNWTELGNGRKEQGDGFSSLWYKKLCLEMCDRGFQNTWGPSFGFVCFLAARHSMRDLSSLLRDWTHVPLWWKHRVLTAGLQWKSQDPSVWISVCSQHAGASRGSGLREPVPGKGGGSGSVGLCGCWPGGQLVAAEPIT